MRARDVLARSDGIACEDTRVDAQAAEASGHFQAAVALRRSQRAERPGEIDRIDARERAVALVSDAGTPLVSDPGYRLVREARGAGIPVTVLPGANAPLAALALSGLPTDRFLFAGFLPVKDKARRDVLEELASVRATLIFFETAPRLARSLVAIEQVLPGARGGGGARIDQAV